MLQVQNQDTINLTIILKVSKILKDLLEYICPIFVL